MVPPNMKSARITEVVEAIAHLLKVKNYKVIKTGIRPGEKLHEVMTSQHGPREAMCSHTWPRYTREELMKMLEPIVCP
jgi:FlaA1/EpsC-like NDP-sugar epimerase